MSKFLTKPKRSIANPGANPTEIGASNHREQKMIDSMNRSSWWKNLINASVLNYSVDSQRDYLDIYIETINLFVKDAALSLIESQSRLI